MKVAKDMIPADLAIVPFVSIKGNYIITSILWHDREHSVKRLINLSGIPKFFV